MAPVFIKRYGKNSDVGKYTELYEFIIDQTNDDVVISYDGENKNYSPAYMNFSTGVFNYGDWGNVFFMKNTRPCIVLNEGGVYKYLDKNNFYNDIYGNDCESIVKGSEGHSTMIEFPKIYWKVEHIQDNVDKVLISDGKADEDFECYANKNVYGEEINKFYVSAFESINLNSRIVSCADSSYYLIGTKSDSTFGGLEKADKGLSTKGDNSDRIWTMLKCCDKAIIDFLIILISKSIDCQASFGNGNVSGFSSTATGKGAVRAGTMVNDGMFMGYNDIRGKGVKVFGIENYWGNIEKCVRCFAFDRKNIYIKMIEGESTKDSYMGAGETDYDYKFNENDIEGLLYNKIMMIKKMHVGVFGFFPKEVANTSNNLYFKDSIYFTNANPTEYNRYGIKTTGGYNYGTNMNGINYFRNSLKENTTFNYNFFMSLKPRASVVNV